MGWIGSLWIELVVDVAACWLHLVGERLGRAAMLVTGGLGALFDYHSDQFAHLYADDQIMAWMTTVVGATPLPAAWGLVRR